jgi:hypothetical protein
MIYRVNDNREKQGGSGSIVFLALARQAVLFKN